MIMAADGPKRRLRSSKLEIQTSTRVVTSTSTEKGYISFREVVDRVLASVYVSMKTVLEYIRFV